jgi:hypothetical protein
MTHRKTLATDLTSIVGVEVKKLERTPAGTIARASGMDYNTTPPCGKIRVYDMGGTALDIRGFYLFVCQEPFGDRLGCYCLSALTLCDGNMLNADFEYYLSIVGERTKEIGVGSYGNGANRSRPMLIFANPLGVPQLDKSVTLIHPSMHLEHEFPEMKRIGTVRRTVSGKNIQAPFWCYRFGEHVSSALTPFDLLDPFLTPTRTEKTQPRGRFRVNLHLAD